MSRYVGEFRFEMLCDLLSRGDPYILMFLHVEHEGSECFCSARFADDAGVQGDIHDFGGARGAFAVEHVEGGFEVVEVHGRTDESGGHVEFAICLYLLEFI